MSERDAFLEGGGEKEQLSDGDTEAHSMTGGEEREAADAGDERERDEGDDFEAHALEPQD